jgi:hypothetical protein
MIGHKHKFIFIQVPKTGSTSVQNTLKKYGGTVKRTGIYNKHIPYSKLQKTEDFKNITEYFSFSFIRNPWDWLVSNYFYCRGVHRPYLDRYNSKLAKQNCTKIFSAMSLRKKILNPMGFEEWLFWYTNNNFATQLEIIENTDKKVSLDFIGKYENLQEDFNIICDKIGIPKQKLPFKNASKHKHYTEYYDDETRQIVAERYAKDIEYFGYEFGE